MSRWLVDCAVDSEFALDVDEHVIFQDPISRAEVFVATPQVLADGLPEFLSFKVAVEANTPEEAEDRAVDLVSGVLDRVVAFTGARATLKEVASVIDWTPGVTPRRGWAFRDSARAAEAGFRLSEILPQIQETLENIDIPGPSARAMRWIRKAINETMFPEQFLFFWVALEIISNTLDPTPEVEDRCPFCRQPLGVCPHCGRELKHQPYPTQAIRHVMVEILKQPQDFFDLVSNIRHAYIHGRDLLALERELGFEWHEVVDRFGLLVLEAVLLTLKPGRAGRIGKVLRPSTVIRGVIRATAYFGYSPDEADLQNPDPFKTPKFNVDIVIKQGSGNAPASQ